MLPTSWLKSTAGSVTVVVMNVLVSVTCSVFEGWGRWPHAQPTTWGPGAYFCLASTWGTCPIWLNLPGANGAFPPEGLVRFGLPQSGREGAV